MLKLKLIFLTFCIALSLADERDHWCDPYAEDTSICYVKDANYESSTQMILYADLPSSVMEVFFYRGKNKLPKVYKGICDNLPNVERIFLWKSGVEEIQDGAFTNCEKLTILNLSGNLLSHIPSSAFRGLNAVKTLVLSSNHLTNLNAGTLKYNMPELNLININDNDFKCSILEAIYRELENRGIQTAADLDPLSDRQRTGMGNFHDMLCIED